LPVRGHYRVQLGALFIGERPLASQCEQLLHAAVPVGRVVRYTHVHAGSALAIGPDDEDIVQADVEDDRGRPTKLKVGAMDPLVARQPIDRSYIERRAKPRGDSIPELPHAQAAHAKQVAQARINHDAHGPLASFCPCLALEGRAKGANYRARPLLFLCT